MQDRLSKEQKHTSYTQKNAQFIKCAKKLTNQIDQLLENQSTYPSIKNKNHQSQSRFSTEINKQLSNLQKFTQYKSLQSENQNLINELNLKNQFLQKNNQKVILQHQKLEQQNDKLKKENELFKTLIKKSHNDVKKVLKNFDDMKNAIIGMRPFVQKKLSKLKSFVDDCMTKIEKQFRSKRKQLKKQFQQTQKTIKEAYSDLITLLLPQKPINSTYSRQNLQAYYTQFSSTLHLKPLFTESTILKTPTLIASLTNHIQNFSKPNIITHTKTLYKYDILNKQNFHKYIDNHNHLLLLIELANGTIIGGYSQYQFCKQRMEKPGNGFLFNMNFDEVYLMKQGQINSVLTYDDYYIIFGNTEIRIKALDDIVFSNFGTSKATFNTQQRKFVDFIGQQTKSKEVKLKHYEIYQLTLK